MPAFVMLFESQKFVSVWDFFVEIEKQRSAKTNSGIFVVLLLAFQAILSRTQQKPVSPAVTSSHHQWNFHAFLKWIGSLRRFMIQKTSKD